MYLIIYNIHYTLLIKFILIKSLKIKLGMNDKSEEYLSHWVKNSIFSLNQINKLYVISIFFYLKIPSIYLFYNLLYFDELFFLFMVLKI